jgi:GT2 family glycosyltransferase
MINISIVIPVFTEHENLKYLLPAINQQTLHPCEIVIIDSCPHTEVKELIDNIHIEIPIHYHRENKRAFPGKARNIGVSIAKHEYIAFLDCRTIPSDNWLQHHSQLIKENDASMIIGSTTVLADSKFQWFLRTATYGKRSYDSVPGTLMEKRLFESTGGFLEDLRMAEDLEWLKRLRRNQIKIISVATPFLKYDGLPKSLFSACQKYFESGYYTSFVMENFKNLLLSALLLASILVIPKWNYYLFGWDSNPFFIPNVTKIVFLIVSSLLLIWRLFYVLTPRVLPDNIFVFSVKLTIFIIITLSVYNWNASMALWVEDAVLYIPHVTKIYVGLLLGSAFIYRGLIKPMMNETPLEDLLPKNWLFVGLVGVSIDIAKIPGTILGAMTGRLRGLARPPNTIEKQDY